jgi:hypothetical protein
MSMNVGYDDPKCHTATVDIELPAQQVYDYLAEPMNRDEWAPDIAPRTKLADDFYVGHWAGSDVKEYARYRANPEAMIIDAANGASPDELFWASSIRVIPGPALGLSDDVCQVTLMCWRTVADNDEFWFDMFHSYYNVVNVLKRVLLRRKANAGTS